MSPSQVDDLRAFYLMLDDLKVRSGGVRQLQSCNGRMPWPNRGLYFFFEEGETRSVSGDGQRVVRVGTHALKQGARTTLWSRLAQHRGNANNRGGNHRGSVFRLHVGMALLRRNANLSCDSWGQGSTAGRTIRESEHFVEVLVSEIIGHMPVLWLEVDDLPGPQSRRGYIERNAIALLSTSRNQKLDQSSDQWLGRHSRSKHVTESGLWNVNHVEEQYDRMFLRHLEKLIEKV